jgi:uncharacterized protein (DUF2147 family)
MTTLTKRAIAPLIIGLTMACHPVFAASSPTGIWLDHTGRGAVEITDCDGKLCGHIVWLRCGQYCHRGLQVIGNAADTAESGWRLDLRPREGLQIRGRSHTNTMW